MTALKLQNLLADAFCEDRFSHSDDTADTIKHDKSSITADMLAAAKEEGKSELQNELNEKIEDIEIASEKLYAASLEFIEFRKQASNSCISLLNAMVSNSFRHSLSELQLEEVQGFIESVLDRENGARVTIHAGTDLAEFLARRHSDTPNLTVVPHTDYRPYQIEIELEDCGVEYDPEQVLDEIQQILRKVILTGDSE